jgi:hypothetical protein
VGAEGLEPLVDVGERLRPQPVPAAATIASVHNQAGLAQHPQVLGDARLTLPQLPDQIADRSLTGSEQVEDLPA